MATEKDIEVNIYLCSPSLDAVLFSTTIDTIESVLFKSELADLIAIENEFRDIPQVAIDAAQFRLRKLKGHALSIKKIEQGSIVLGGLLGGLVIWVLNATIGATLKEAWLGTESHRKIKEFLLKNQRSKVLDIERQIEAKLPRQLTLKHYSSDVEVSVLGTHPDYPSRVDVRVKATFVVFRTPSRGEALGENHKELIISSKQLSQADF